MALWDAAAKAAGLPLHRFLARRLGLAEDYPQRVPVYAGGGYPYPHDDLGRLEEELRRFVDLGYTHAKIKIGAAGLDGTGAVSTGRCGFSATLRGWRSTR